MKFIDLFAGIGGFHLGMEQAGHECVGWVEWDKFARKSYQTIFETEGVWNASDIRTVRSTEIPRKVDWREDYAGFFCGETPLYACLSEWDNDIKYPQTFPEIVGNVHENPELLEAQHDTRTD